MTLSGGEIASILGGVALVIGQIANLIVSIRNGKRASDRGHKIVNTLAVVASQTNGLTKALIKSESASAKEVGRAEGIESERSDQRARESQL